MPVTRILVLAANPINTDKLRLDQEVREIMNGLARAKHRSNFDLLSVWAPRPIDVRRAVLDYSPTIVHFSGHGDGSRGIAFEDNVGNAQLVSAEALAGFFKLFSDKVKYVVLNACYSKTQAESIVEDIDYVIGMKKEIGDEAAIEFSIALYDALGAGKNIEFAFELACNSLLWSNIPENLTPVLLSKSNQLKKKQ